MDAESAAFADVADVHLAGLAEGEWPQRARRTIFYSSGLLRQLGWPAESERAYGERTLLRDLLRLPSRRLIASSFLLEDDAIVTPSPFSDEVEAAGLEPMEAAVSPTRIFDVEALTLDPPRADVMCEPAASWAQLRLEHHARFQVSGVGFPVSDSGFEVSARPTQLATRNPAPDTRHPTPDTRAYSLSALERYQDCPFKFFAADVLRLDEPPEDRSTLTPRGRGRFIHEVFQRFFEEWDRQGGGTITPERLDRARGRFVEVAEEMLARIPDVEAALERARLFGSPAAVGIVDVVLGLEASTPEPVVGRWLEYRLDGEFALGVEDGRRAPLRGVVDRVDLLEGRRLRVIDYKSGAAPNVKRALQVPVYALCASDTLNAQGGEPWTVAEAAYIALSGKRTLVPVVKRDAADAGPVLGAARERVFAALDAIARGEFPPRPVDTMICSYCAYASVCRKDYVGAE